MAEAMDRLAKEMSARTTGYANYNDGLSWTDCPYDAVVEIDLFDAWIKGYRDAARDAFENNVDYLKAKYARPGNGDHD